MGYQIPPADIDTLALLGPAVRAFLASPHRLLIDGDFVAAASGETFETLDPATGQKIADVAHAGAADVEQAVAAATRALEGPWGRLLPAAREALLLRFAALVEAHAEDLSRIEALDSGKPAAQIKAVDIALGVAALRYNAGWVTKIEGRTLPVSVPDMHVYTRREPVGVVAAVVPWNFPLCQACFKLAPALAAGCTVVLKPAEQTPLSALYLGRLALEAGLPPGVVNVLPGFGATTGEALISHPGVAKIAFTGSEKTGKHIARAAAGTLKHVSLELGGKNPNVIFADADVDAAATVAAMAIFFYSGQVCAAGSRLMVERPVYDRVVEAVAAEAGKLKLGHGLAAGTFMGPLVSAQQLERVEGFVARAADAGVQVARCGARPEGALAGGFFHLPTILAGAGDGTEVVREEIFGPVLVVQPFDSLEELKLRANATSFGLSAGVWTRDIKKAHATAAALQAGTVWINTYGQFDATAPWGGFKQSGYGRDNGAESLDKYLQTKTIWTAVA